MAPTPQLTTITDAAHTVIADKGYLGTDFLIGYKKTKTRPLTPAQKGLNQHINRLRAPVERTIANLKTWRILHSDYRRPLHTWKHTHQKPLLPQPLHKGF